MNWAWKSAAPRRYDSRPLDGYMTRPPPEIRPPHEIRPPPEYGPQSRPGGQGLPRMTARTPPQQRRASSPPRRNDVHKPRATGQSPGKNTVEAQEIVSGMNEDDMRRILVGILRKDNHMRSKAKDLNQYQYSSKVELTTSPTTSPATSPATPPTAAANRNDLKKWDKVHDLAQFDDVGRGRGQSRNVLNGDARYGDNFWNQHEEVLRQEKLRPVDWGDTLRIDFKSEKTYKLRPDTTETVTEDSGWKF